MQFVRESIRTQRVGHFGRTMAGRNGRHPFDVEGNPVDMALGGLHLTLRFHKSLSEQLADFELPRGVVMHVHRMRFDVSKDDRACIGISF